MSLSNRKKVMPATAPWVVICHGLGDSHRGWLPIVPYLQLPQCGYAVVDAPIPVL